MFLKTGEMKKIMKSSLKRYGLIVGNIDGHYLVYADNWGVFVEIPYATNKFKAAIMELIGDLPEPEECYMYTVGTEKDLNQESVMDYPDPYENWKRAKDFAIATPIFLASWPHEYGVYQRKSDLGFMVARRSLTDTVMSQNELDTTLETMPERPGILSNVLYFKNESTIYWVHTENPGEKAREALYPHLVGMNFFNDDWIDDEEKCVDPEEDDQETEDDAAEQLPY